MSFLSAYRLRAILSTVFVSGLFCLASFYNRFPILYPDSSAYLFFAEYLKSRGERPPFYGLWLALGGRLFPAYWFGVVSQSLVAALLIRWIMVAHGFRRLELSFCAVSFALAAFTGICWQTGQLMADAFTAPMVLAFYLLVLRAEDLAGPKRVAAELILLLSILVHNSHWLILLVSLALIWAGFWVRGRRLFPSTPAVLLLSILAVLPLTTMVNSALGLGFFYSKNQYAFMMSRLVEDKSVSRFLAENCDKKIYLFCDEQAYLSAQNATSFLWGERSPFKVVEDQSSAYRDLILAIFWAEPWQQMSNGMLVFGQQLLRFDSGEAVGRWPEQAWEYQNLRNFLPDAFAGFQRSRQQNNDWTDLFSRLNTVYLVVFVLALFGLSLGWWRRAGSWPEEITFALTICLFFFTNAFVCGIFSGANHRYQSRIAWLPVFAALLFLVRWIQERRRGRL